MARRAPASESPIANWLVTSRLELGGHDVARRAAAGRETKTGRRRAGGEQCWRRSRPGGSGSESVCETVGQAAAGVVSACTMSPRRGVTLVLALVAICDASPAGAWAFGRRFGSPSFHAARYNPFYGASGRYSRANAGYESAPIRFAGHPQGRALDSAIEAAEEPAAKLNEGLETGADNSDVSFQDLPAQQPAATAEAAHPPAEGSPATEETKASSVFPESTPPSGGLESEPEPVSSSIFFPGQPTSLEPKAGDVFVPECDGVPFMALNPDTGRCQFLMMRTECPEGQWFILDRDTLEASCQPLPCPEQEVLFDGVCMPRDDASLCPEGMVVLINEYGDASCDCAVKNLYWPAHDRCYPAYRRGPCHAGHYLTVGDEGVRCSENVCFRDGAALWRATRRCYRLQDEADSPCALGRLDVDPDTLELECVETEPFAIFDLPVVRCSKGSKLDYGGRCKRELYQKFRSSFTSDVTRNKKCGDGLVLGISGRCLKAAKDPAL